MTDQHDKQNPEEDSTPPETGEQEENAGSSEEEEVRKLEMSEELRAALEEAENSLQQAERQGPEQKSQESSEEQEPPKEEQKQAVAEADKDKEAEAPAGDELDIEVEEEKFDPNQVDEYQEESAPPPPSQAEMELKMQVLELRQKLRDKEAELEQKLKEMKQNAEQARHLQKQFESYKARTNKEKSDWFNYGHEPILKELLSVKDNLERAVHHAGESMEVESLRQGVELTLRQLLAIMEKFGVSGIDSEGEPFNPEYHQAMMQVTDDSVPSGTVVEEHQKGYLLKDRLLRPSMVSVSKRSEASKEAEKKEQPSAGTPAAEIERDDVAPADEEGLKAPDPEGAGEDSGGKSTGLPEEDPFDDTGSSDGEK